MYYKSAAWGKYCQKVFGSDLKQIGMVTNEELEIFLQEAKVKPGSSALDLGFGVGFMAEKVSNEMDINVTGINIDEDEVAFAKSCFTNNPKLSFMQMDFNNMMFPRNTKFDLIYSFDTMYFTFSIEKLHALLDSCFNLLNSDGKLAIFWSNMPKVYPMELPGHEFTQIGLWAKRKNLIYKSFDFTQKHRAFWINGLKVLTEMESEFRAEGYEYYDNHIEEYTTVSQLCADGNNIFRWLYIFEKHE